MKTMRALPKDFYERDTHLVARELLGTLLVREIDDEMMAVRICEVESYVGQDDLACHASKGKTPRTATMFGEAGRAYVYLIYGMYHCLNIVTEAVDFPAAVLIRAGEPVAGVDIKRTNGPGKLCQALAITREHNGLDITGGNALWIADDGYEVRSDMIGTGPRIGVDYAGACAAWPWRYALKGSEYLSRPI